MADVPAARQPLDAQARGHRGSDDPLVFNSSLPMEYQLLFDSLLLAGLTDAEALEWLDRVRRTGMERRFTTPGVTAADLFALENLTPMDPPSF